MSLETDTTFEPYLDFIRSQDKVHEMERKIYKYALLTENSLLNTPQTKIDQIFQG